jgi:hypothetical protein
MVPDWNLNFNTTPVLTMSDLSELDMHHAKHFFG